MWLAHPELAQEVVQRRIEASPADFVTYCAMCRDFFARQGKPTLHLLDLLYARDPVGAARQPGPTFSQRHENRARLKRRLLKELWSEDMNDPMSYASIRLVIPAEVQEMLEKRLILVEDIQQVLEMAERTGARLVNKQTGHSLAYQKLGSVTYWIEYTLQDGAYLIHKAYSHRMELAEEPKK